MMVKIKKKQMVDPERIKELIKLTDATRIILFVCVTVCDFGVPVDGTLIFFIMKRIRNQIKEIKRILITIPQNISFI